MSDEQITALGRWADFMRAENSALNTRAGVTITAATIDAALARIAALEAQVARLTAPVTEEDIRIVERVNAKWYEHVLPEYARDLLTAFLERRMKG